MAGQATSRPAYGFISGLVDSPPAADPGFPSRAALASQESLRLREQIGISAVTGHLRLLGLGLVAMRAKMSSRIMVCAIILSWCSLAFAQSPQEQFAGAAYLPGGAGRSLENLATATGAFTHAVPVEVPSFRSLAPSL